MNIVSSNFQDQLPNIIQAAEKCEFMAIDLELTGIKGENEP